MFDNESGAKRLLLSSLLGATVATVGSLILILLSALILGFTKDPASIIAPLGKAILYITAIIGGYIAKAKGEKIASPIISGALMTVLILLISMLTKEGSADSPIGTAVAYIIIFLAFIAGGLLHTLITSKHPTRRKKRRR